MNNNLIAMFVAIILFSSNIVYAGFNQVLPDEEFLWSLPNPIITSTKLIDCGNGASPGTFVVEWKDGIPRSGYVIGCDSVRHDVNYFDHSYQRSRTPKYTHCPEIYNNSIKIFSENLFNLKIIDATTGDTVLDEMRMPPYPNNDFVPRAASSSTLRIGAPSLSPNATGITIDFAHLATGIYFIIIFNQNNDVVYVKTIGKGVVLTDDPNSKPLMANIIIPVTDSLMTAMSAPPIATWKLKSFFNDTIGYIDIPIFINRLNGNAVQLYNVPAGAPVYIGNEVFTEAAYAWEARKTALAETYDGVTVTPSTIVDSSSNAVITIEDTTFGGNYEPINVEMQNTRKFQLIYFNYGVEEVVATIIDSDGPYILPSHVTRNGKYVLVGNIKVRDLTTGRLVTRVTKTHFYVNK